MEQIRQIYMKKCIKMVIAIKIIEIMLNVLQHFLKLSDHSANLLVSDIFN